MKKEEKTECTRQKILNAAIEAFGKNGYAGASINSVCDAGISKGLLYHNFKNRDAVYLACVSKCFSDLTAYLKNAEIGCDPEKYANARLHFFEQNENMAHLFFEALLQPPPPLAEQIKQLRREFDALNATIYATVLDSIQLRPGITRSDAQAYFNLMQTMFNGYFSSPACCNMSFAERISAHESSLKKLLDCMLYGIAEKEREP